MVKKILLTLVVFLFMCSSSFAVTREYTLAWNANTEPDVAGYTIYSCGADGSGATVVGVLPWTIGDPCLYGVSVDAPDLAETEYCWAIDAFDASGNKSEKSDAACVTVDTKPPSKPTGLIASLVQLIVSVLKVWWGWFS